MLLEKWKFLRLLWICLAQSPIRTNQRSEVLQAHQRFNMRVYRSVSVAVGPGHTSDFYGGFINNFNKVIRLGQVVGLGHICNLYCGIINIKLVKGIVNEKYNFS